MIVHAPLGFATHGAGAERASWEAALAGVPDLRPEIQTLVEAGDTLAARVVVSGTHRGDFAGVPGSGRRFAIDQATFVR